MQIKAVVLCLLLAACATGPRPSPFQDIIDWQSAENDAALEAFQAGKLTDAEYKARIRATGMTAQTQIATRSAAYYRPGALDFRRPVTCTTINGITTCI